MKLIGLCALAAIGLAACNDAGRGGTADSRICTPFNTATPAAADASAPVDDCLHRWAYTLAGTSDPAQQVAEATVAACASALTTWNQQAVSAPGAAASETQAPSLLNGQPTTPLQEHYSFAQARALFYVIQARAGKCSAPPAQANGQPGTPAVH